MGIHWREVLLMSRSIRGSKGCGYDYWGKRAMSQCSPGRENKKLTLGIERMRERKEIIDLIELGDPCYMMEES